MEQVGRLNYNDVGGQTNIGSHVEWSGGHELKGHAAVGLPFLDGEAQARPFIVNCLESSRPVVYVVAWREKKEKDQTINLYQMNSLAKAHPLPCQT